MTIDEALAWLEARLPRERALGLDRLADVIEYERPPAAQISRALLAVLEILEREQDPAVLESALHALATAASLGHAPLVAWEPLARALPRWEKDRQQLEYALQVLGSSHDPKWRTTLERYVTFPGVEATARDALAELEGRRS